MQKCTYVLSNADNVDYLLVCLVRNDRHLLITIEPPTVFDAILEGGSNEIRGCKELCPISGPLFLVT